MRAVFTFIHAVLFLAAFLCRIQSGVAQDVLETYISEGLKGNLLLQQRNVSLQKAMYALKSAQSMYLPSVDLLADYLTADGGRNIPLPIGDMLNPVYSTLNQLTQSDNFPQIDNETINFLPRNFYDVRVRASLPLLNTDIGHNKRIHEQQVRLQEYEVDIYRRELVKEIKTAYFAYLNAEQAAAIHESALELAQEGKRVNEKLVESGTGLPAYVLRSGSEVAQSEARLEQAWLQVRNAKLYFNSLLNRPGDSDIDTRYDSEHALAEAAAMLHRTGSVDGREEIQSLRTAVSVHETVLKMNRHYRVPKINAFLDLGSQSEGLRFNGQTRYYMAGLQLTLPLYSGNRNKMKVQQTQLDVEDAQLQLAQAEQQLQLSNSVANHDLQSAWRVYQSSLQQLETAHAYQRLVDRGYKAGTNTYIETVDARNQYTTARIAALINQYRVLSAAAVVERENASYPLTP